MYGKHFESMYEGSMVGSGPVVFALMGYVISKTYASKVELNPVILATVFGCPVREVEAAIKKLCAPDAASRNKEHEGRRLVKEGSFQYHVVSWVIYHNMRSRVDRREYNKIKQREYRAKVRAMTHTPLPGEAGYLAAEANGAGVEELERLAEPRV